MRYKDPRFYIKMQYQDEDSSKRNTHPIPKGNSFYSLAKQAEYIERNIPLAQCLYRKSIDNGEKVESALKDLASLLHKEGKTQMACDLLLSYQDQAKDKGKLNNLLKSLSDKLIPSQNTHNKTLKLSPISAYDSIYTIKRLFRDPSRILYVEIVHCDSSTHGLIHFSTHSAARKTLTTLQKRSTQTVEWMNTAGGVSGVAVRYSRNVEYEAKSNERELAIQLIGRDLFTEVFC